MTIVLALPHVFVVDCCTDSVAVPPDSDVMLCLEGDSDRVSDGGYPSLPTL